MIDLNEIAKEAYTTAWKRYKVGSCKSNPQDTIAMQKHTAGEVVEATEAYIKWCETKYDENLETKLIECKKAFSSELMDVIVCALITAHFNGIDVEKELKNCLAKNAKRA